MAKPELIETLHKIAQPIVASKGLEIWGIDLLQGGRPLVRVYVDVPYEHKSSGATLTPATETELAEDSTSTEMKHISASIDQCAEISRMMGLTMEVEDIFASAYILEVSTPGFSRMFFQLEQLRGYEGDTLEISLNDFLADCPDFLHGRKKIKGTLVSVNLDEGTFDLSLGHTQDPITLTLSWDLVRKMSREHIFVMPEKPGKKRKNEK